MPGRPFFFIEGPLPDERTGRGQRWTGWSTLRLHAGDFEIWFSPTSNYWKEMVDTQSLSHRSIVGVRRRDREVMRWDEIDLVREVLENFLGWINHCASPVFHAKAYRKGKLLYREYNLRARPTLPRDRFSWLPSEGPDGYTGRFDGMVEKALNGFGREWVKNRQNRGILHIALQLLRSKERGSWRSRASVLYLRDTFAAIGILTSILSNSQPTRGRPDTMMKCLRELGVEDELPIEAARRYLIDRHEELWRAARTGSIQENERVKGTLSRPLANVQTWLVHLDDFDNADRLLNLGAERQSYFVDLSAWLADLLLMKVVGYDGYYLDRLTGIVRKVPWTV